MNVALPAADISKVKALISEPPSLPLRIKSASETEDLIIKLFDSFSISPIVVPPALKNISLPAASSIISPDESKVISVPSFVIVSRAILPTFVILKSPKFVVPPIVRLPVTVTLSPKVTSEVLCPIAIAIPEVKVASLNSPVEFAKYEFDPSWYSCRSSPVPPTYFSPSGK